MIEFTKDTEIILDVAYKCYLEQVKSADKSRAAFIPADFYKKDKATSSMSQRDVNKSLTELKNKGFVQKFIDGSFKLTSDAIAFRENYVKDFVKGAIDTAVNAISIFKP